MLTSESTVWGRFRLCAGQCVGQPPIKITCAVAHADADADAADLLDHGLVDVEGSHVSSHHCCTAKAFTSEAQRLRAQKTMV
jgi:hypothetical protein